MRFTKLPCVKLLIFTVVLLSVSVAQAHHSSAPHYDHDDEIKVSGTFTKIRFVNPHAYLYFDVEQDGKVTPWRCELQSATQLKRNGWNRDMFSEGQEFTITGSPARREDNVCYLNSLMLADGTEIMRYENFDRDAPVQAGPISAPISIPTDRPVKHANGQPNLKGPWVSLSFGRKNTLGKRPKFTASEAGKAAAEGYQMEYDDPILRCHYVNLIGGWNHDKNANDIHQKEDTVTMQYGFMDVVRTIHLNQGKHPENIIPSSTGHSIGRWDGDTLVVETIGFEEGVLSHSSGMKHSEQMRVVERIHVNQETMQLIRDYTITDPLYLEGVTTGQDIMGYTETPYSRYNCTELSGKNNIRSDDERYQKVDSSGLAATVVSDTASSKPEEVEVKSNSSEINTDSGKKGGSLGVLSLFVLGMLGFARRRIS